MQQYPTSCSPLQQHRIIRHRKASSVLYQMRGAAHTTPRVALQPCRDAALKGSGHNRGRVAWRSCPPQAPTDPDVPHSGIRLLRHTTLLRFGRRVHDRGFWQWIVDQQPVIAFPVQSMTLGAALQPLPPHSSDLPTKGAECLQIPGDPIIRVVPAQLHRELLVFPCHLGVAVLSAPHADPLERATEAR